jgi:hypothetical protein
MATESELEFEYFLAEQLHMIVADMRRKMSNSEFVHWMVYFGRKAQAQELANMKAQPRGRRR